MRGSARKSEGMARLYRNLLTRVLPIHHLFAWHGCRYKNFLLMQFPNDLGVYLNDFLALSCGHALPPGRETGYLWSCGTFTTAEQEPSFPTVSFALMLTAYVRPSASSPFRSAIRGTVSE